MAKSVSSMHATAGQLEGELDRLPSGLSTHLRAGLRRGVVPSPTVGDCLAESGLRLEQLMVLIVPLAAAYARAPVAGFAVGAAENAAFNPRLLAIQSALSLMQMQLAAGPTRIREAVLVERPGKHPGQIEETRSLLSTVAPHARLVHHQAADAP